MESAVASGDGNVVVALCVGNTTLTVWDARTNEHIEYEHTRECVAPVAVSPDGQRVALCARGTIATYVLPDMDHNGLIVIVSSPVVALAFGSDHDTLLAAFDNKTVKLVSGMRSTTLATLPTAATHVAASLEWLVAFESSGLLHLWDANTSVLHATLCAPSPACVGIGIEPRQVVLGCATGEVACYNTDTPVCHRLAFTPGGVTSVSVANGRIEIVRCFAVEVWDLTTGACLKTLVGWHTAILRHNRLIVVYFTEIKIIDL